MDLWKEVSEDVEDEGVCIFLSGAASSVRNVGSFRADEVSPEEDRDLLSGGQ